MATEMPMAGCRQRNTVLNDVRSTVLDSANVRSLDFRFSSAVDHSKPGNGAGFFVGSHFETPKCPIPRWTIYQHPRDLAFPLFRSRFHECLGLPVNFRDSLL